MYAATLAILASVAAALPQGVTPPQGEEPFTIISTRSGSQFHLLPGSATRGSLLIGSNNNDAVCDAAGNQVIDFATFKVTAAGEAFLYSTDTPKQQLYVDRSGMGQGKVGYITGDQSAPRNAELSGFSVSADGYFLFDGISPQACPGSALGGSSLWWTTQANPAFQEGCQGVGILAVKADPAYSCTYSE